MTSKKNLDYSSLGSSSTKEGLHSILDDMGVMHQKPYFCQFAEDISGSKDHVSFIHSDGAGTKTIIPYLLYKETGNLDFFRRLPQDALVMNLDDIYCLGNPDNMILSNAISRNTSHITDDILKVIIESYYNLGEKLINSNIPIIISGGETADCGDIVRTLIVDATIYGRTKKENLIHPQNISPGDVIVSLASFGQATYEDEENSGIGSNGLTLARHALLNKENSLNYPEINNPNTSNDISYQGPYKVTDTLDLLNGKSVGDALSSPTRTYAPVLSKIFSKIGCSNISGIIHLTGGAHSKVLRFIPPCRIVKNNLFEVPPIFKLIQEKGEVSNHEMYQVFNMGQRMDIFCKKELAEELISISDEFNIAAKISGYVEASDTPEVKILLENEEITYAL